MKPRDRVINAFNFKKLDKPAVQYLYWGPGYYEHGEKLNDLYEQYPGDFGSFARNTKGLRAIRTFARSIFNGIKTCCTTRASYIPEGNTRRENGGPCLLKGTRRLLIWARR